ncbi:isocitrate lyase/PEP mutase family protein [Desulfobacterales bacterium HSG16]|nr:isocitrate lyase/PEP mutase family protein [Desulfobacterales bacterium HSG16]
MKPVEKLRQLLLGPDILMVPGCYDALSAKLIEKAGFQAAFMGGFSVSASRLALPDTGLISYGEMVDQGRNICSAVSIPIFGDGDTGYGNAVNVKRTVEGYASAGFACVMIEDQVWPKRCGHTKGKLTVDRAEAFARIQAAVDAREGGADIMIMARTDANATIGFKEAVLRARTFAEMGADVTFLEAPETIDEMKEYCDKVPGLKMANMLEQGKTPVLSPSILSNIGFNIAAYPLTLLLASVNAVEKALDGLLRNEAAENTATFSHLKDIVGFPEYYETEKKYE